MDDDRWAMKVKDFVPPGKIAEHFVLMLKMLDNDGKPTFTFASDDDLDHDIWLGIVESGKFAMMRQLTWEEDDDA